MYRSNNTRYRGIVVTDTLGIKSFRAIDNPTYIYDGFSDLEKWQFMSEGFADTIHDLNRDASMLAATRPWDIPAGDSIKTSLALVGANNLTDLQNFAQRAIDKYQTSLMCAAIPGDLNASNTITLSDVIYIVNYLFDKDNPPCLGSDPGNCWIPAPFCRADVNASGTITLSDVIYIVNHLFDKDNPPCLGSDPVNCWPPVFSSVCCIAP